MMLANVVRTMDTRMVVVHLVARIALGAPSLTEAAIAPVVWRALRRSFPDALACVLMPDHVHLIVPARSAARTRRRLAIVLGHVQLTRGAARRVRWERVPLPVVIPDRKHLARQVRYVVLNPCRAGLVACPVAWLWSTHRDVIGAVADPWVTAARLSRALGQRLGGFVAAHHRYVSSDPSAHVMGTPLPRAAEPSSVTREPLAAILTAAAAAVRASPSHVRSGAAVRDLFIAAARRQGWKSARLLAAITGLSARSVRRRALDHPALASAALCLGDARLRSALDDAAQAFLHDAFNHLKADEEGGGAVLRSAS